LFARSRTLVSILAQAGNAKYGPENGSGPHYSRTVGLEGEATSREGLGGTLEDYKRTARGQATMAKHRSRRP
jgi:hypothetical protein